MPDSLYILPVTELRLDFEYGHSIDLVWQALTDRQLHRDWWIPTDLMPIAGGVFRAFPPPGLPGFGGPFDMDMVTVDAPVKLVMRWRGEESHFEVTWSLLPIPRGCRLRVTQQGFFGISGDERREQLRRTYEMLFAQRLPQVLQRLAALDPEPEPVAVPWTRPSGTTKVPESARVESHSGRWRTVVRRSASWLRRVTRIPNASRMTLLSLVGVLVLTVLAVTALTALLLRPAVLPAGAADVGAGPAQGAQAGTVEQDGSPSGNPSVGTPLPSITPSGAGSRSPSAGPSRRPESAGPAPVAARFGVQQRYELGYIGSITVAAGAREVADWSARIELPDGGSIYSAWDQMSVSTSGRVVTITPLAAHRVIGAGQSFTFAFQVNLDTRSGDGIPTACTVDGVVCTGM